MVIGTGMPGIPLMLAMRMRPTLPLLVVTHAQTPTGICVCSTGEPEYGAERHSSMDGLCVPCWLSWAPLIG